jgi:nucleotide-binding universal stress UspA family protein
MTIQKILLPYNFTILDKKAVDFVSDAFSHIEGADIMLFHAYTPAPDLETADTLVTGKLKSSLSFLTQKIMQQEKELEAIKNQLVINGFTSSRIHISFKPRKKDVASEIIDFASQEKVDAIVINHKSGKATRFFTGSVFNKIVSTVKNTAVCIVS